MKHLSRKLLCLLGGSLFGIAVFQAVAPSAADASFQSFAITTGPAFRPLKTNDQYASLQWAYLNDGTFERQVVMNYLQLTEEALLDHRLAEPAAGDGPASRAYLTIESQPNIDLNLESAWQAYDETANKREVVVALIDSGVDITHPDLMDSFWINSGEIAGDGIDNDNNGYVDDVYGWNFIDNTAVIHDSALSNEENHGTHGAGTIAASRGNEIGIAGINDNQYVKLMVLKTVNGTRGIGSYKAIVAAIQYAEANGADICNLSLGTYTDYPEIQEAIAQSKMLFVAACGNGDSYYNIGYDIDVSPVYPASYPQDNIISVASLNFDGNLSNSSNYGKNSVDLAAPGESILSTLPNGRYGMMSGTSMAAPIVSGLAAMLYSSHPDWSLADVKTALLSSVKPLDSLQGKVLTGGMPDATAAMQWEKAE